MAILKEWTCRAHGAFEEFAKDGEVPKCPAGCSARFVKRVFLTAPGMLGPRTKNTDQTLRNLASDYRMTNIRNDKAGGSVMDAMRPTGAPKPMWMPMGEAVKKLGGQAKDLTALGFGKGMYGKYQVDARVLGKIPQPRAQYQGRDTGGYPTDKSAP